MSIDPKTDDTTNDLSPDKAALCATGEIAGPVFDEIADAAGVGVGKEERGEVTEAMWRASLARYVPAALSLAREAVELRAAVRVLGRECERNRYFREIKVKHPQVCGEVYREWIEAVAATDANPLAAAAIAQGGKGGAS